MRQAPKLHRCIICGKSFEARTRKYKLTCSTRCGIENYKKWMEKAVELSRNLEWKHQTHPR